MKSLGNGLELRLQNIVKLLLRRRLQADLLCGFGGEGGLTSFPGDFHDWHGGRARRSTTTGGGGVLLLFFDIVFVIGHVDDLFESPF